VTKKNQKPRTLQEFEKLFPETWKAYTYFRDVCDHEGPLNSKTRELIKIGIEVSRKRHGGLVAHLTRAQEAGAKKSEIYQAILLATPLIGLPDVLDAFQLAKEHLK
jgi:alkylhydroperoxidase/carboxymuconolactone decarboxylase family protein YurZ